MQPGSTRLERLGMAALQDMRLVREAIAMHQESAVIFYETGDRHSGMPTNEPLKAHSAERGQTESSQ
jgi:hypothetical protein